MRLKTFFATTAVSLAVSAPAIAAKKAIPTIKPCTETVTTDCKVIAPLDPNQRPQPRQPAQQAQDQPITSQSAPVAPPPPQAQQELPVGQVAVPPPAYQSENSIQIYIDRNGITISGLLRVGPEGFRIGPIVVTNPNYHPPVPALGYAPGPVGR